MPVVKRGYIGGGEVGQDKFATISAFADNQRSPDVRYVRKSGPGQQRDVREYEEDPKTDPYRKGGMIMKKPKGYQHGGTVQLGGREKDTAPGAASASSRPWSANIAGRNVAMKNKGGKVNKIAKGKR